MKKTRVRRRKAACLLLAGLLLCAPLGGGAEEDVYDGEVNLALETRLSELGYFTEVPDEVRDESTQLALGNFQTAHSLEATRRLDSGTTARLLAADCISKDEYLAELAGRYAELVLEPGAVGREVSAMQRALSELGYYTGSADGVYGEATGDAVARFQLAVGLTVTGIADGATLYRLVEGAPPSREGYLNTRSAAKGDTGSSVKLAQQRLKGLGFFAGDCTGAYGDMTARAVEQFQQANALPATGQLDAATCEALYFARLNGQAQPGYPRPGDTGEAVLTLQRQLQELGYYDGSPSGNFDARTQTALALCRIANGLAPGDDAAALDLTAAVRREDAGEAFLASRRGDAEAGARIAARAEALLGQRFASGAELYFPGFAFVQYVLADCGVAVWEAGEIIGGADELPAAAEAPAAGAVVALERTVDGSAQIRLAISLGGNRLALPDEAGQWIVGGDLRQMSFETAYVWTLESADEAE